MRVADQQRDPLAKMAIPSESSNLPVVWTDDSSSGRPRFGLSHDELDALERTRIRRLRIGVGAAVLGLATMVAAVTFSSTPQSDSSADIERAVVLQNAGRLDEAAIIYREVIAEEPRATVAYFNLGVIEHLRGLMDEAAANYEQALDLDSAYVPALFNLAVLRADDGDVTVATGLYRRILTIEPDRAGALLNLGILLLQQGEAEEATGMINRAIALDPSLATASVTGPEPSDAAG